MNADKLGKKGISAVSGSASMIDLKAELYRKQDEMRKAKLSQGNFVRPTSKIRKPNIWSKQNSGVLARAQQDLDAKKEEENDMERSRKALEAKAKLYEKLSDIKNLPDDSEEMPYLVDFEKKAVDDYLNKKKSVEGKDNDRVEDVDVPPPSDPGEEWVDYLDSLGRTRRCMKKDLPEFMEMDRELGNKPGTSHGIETTPRQQDSVQNKAMPDLMSGDMYREMLREKWEKEEREAMDKPAGPIHYENVRFDEVRTHGTGYFQFSKDEATRQEQMATLKNMREKTESQRAISKKVKAKRKAMMAERLKKIRMKKRIKLGLDPEEDDKDDEDDDSGSDSDGSADTPVPAPVESAEFIGPLPKVDVEAPIREWDKGKTDSGSSWTWAKQVEKLRNERHEEFAPPSSYNSASNYNKKSRWNSSSSQSCASSMTDRQNDGPWMDQQCDTQQRQTKSENNRPSEFAPPPCYTNPSASLENTLRYFKESSKS